MPAPRAREAIIIFVTKVKLLFTVINLGRMFDSLLLSVGFLSITVEGC